MFSRRPGLARDCAVSALGGSVIPSRVVAAGVRSTWWTRWPDETAGPLWVCLHLHERAGSAALAGLELYAEPPEDVRGPLEGASATDWSDLLPVGPSGLSGTHLRALSVPELLERWRAATGASERLGPARARYGPDHWGRVAQLVLATAAGGDRRTARAVAERWSVSRPTAKRWIGRVRAMGLLEP